MRRTLALVLALGVSGCVPQRSRLPQPSVLKGRGSTDWSAVAALPRGRFVFVTLDTGEVGPALVLGVSDTSLIVYQLDGQKTIDRARVARLVERVQIGTRRGGRWYIGVPILVAIVGGFAGLISGAKKGHHTLKDVSVVTFVVGLWAAIVVARPVFEDRIVYVRP